MGYGRYKIEKDPCKDSDTKKWYQVVGFSGAVLFRGNETECRDFAWMMAMTRRERRKFVGEEDADEN